MGDTSDLFYFELRQGAQVDASFTPEVQGTFWYLKFSQPSAGNIKFERMGTDATNPLVQTYSQTFSLPATVAFYIDSTKFQYTINGTQVAAATHSWTVDAVYPAFWLTKPGGGAQNSLIKLDNFSIAPQTFTFVSSVKNAPSITSWDTFTTNTTGGGQTFSIRSATGIFTVNSSTPSWAATPSGTIPTLSTGVYFQVRDAFAATSTNSITLTDFTVNWFEGSATDKTYAFYNDNALWWSVTSGTGSTTNNKIIKYDLLNQGWLLYDIPINGMYIRNQRLYFGSPTAGYIYKFGDITNDNGAAINSYWKSKDLIGNNPFVDKDYTRLSLSLLSVTNSSMTVTYTVNGSSSTDVVVPLSSSASFIKKNRNFPQGTTGSTFNVKFGNNAADQPFEVFGIAIDFNPKSWIPQ